MPSSDQPAEKPRKRVGLLRLKAAVALPLLFGTFALAYWFMIDGVVRDLLLSQSKNYAGKGGNSEVENVNFTIFGPKLRVENLRTWQNLEGGSEHEVVYVKEAIFDMEFWPLLERRVVVNELTATQVRWHSPIKDKPEPPPQKLPADTNNPTLNDYLAKAQEVLNSDELREALEWIEKLKQYTSKEEPAEEPAPQPGGNEPALVATETEELGPPRRAPFVTEALSQTGVQPTLVLKLAGVKELDITWGRKGKQPFARKITELLVRAQDISSDPVLYGRAMKFNAEGNLDGEAARRAKIGLTIRFDAQELIRVEQVTGLAGLKTISLKGLADTGLFGDTLHDAEISVTHYAGTHGHYPRRTRLMLAGTLQPPGFDKPAKASCSIWFGGFNSTKAWAAFVPSGIGVQVENFPLQGILKLAGGSPLALEDGPATISFGTCDAQGNFGTPDAAMTWHDGFKVRLRLNVQGARLRETEQAMGGLPGAFVAKGLNRVLEGLGGGLDVIVGFEGSKDRVALGLERPGLRAFVDAIVNALELNASDIAGMVDLPFGVDASAKIGLQSVNADSGERDPALSLSGEARHDFNDLRVALKLDNAALKPKPGQATILGLPAEDFCRAFNAFLGQEGGLILRTRIFNAQGVFSPALENPGVRGLVDSVVGTLSYSGSQMNKSFSLPFDLVDTASAQCASVDAAGATRSMASPGADANNLNDLRISVSLKNGMAAKKKGVETILGVPADYFTFAWNKLQTSAGPNGFLLTLRLFDDKGGYAPALVKPDDKELVKMLGNAVGIDNFTKDFDKLASKYASEFPDFQKRGIDAAKDIASGETKLPDIPKEIPKELPKEVPKLPEVPKIKLPWQK